MLSQSLCSQVSVGGPVQQNEQNDEAHLPSVHRKTKIPMPLYCLELSRVRLTIEREIGYSQYSPSIEQQDCGFDPQDVNGEGGQVWWGGCG